MDKTTMSSFREGDSLSLRLTTLKSFYTDQKNIWDIGCDHGYLGLSFRHLPGIAIHLVDPSLPVIETLTKKIKDSYITKGDLFIHHQNGQSLEINSFSNCIFIAGMGGSEIEEIIRHLLPQLDHTSRIIISPHRKILELRVALSELPLSLLHEEVLSEGNQFYQILVLSPGTSGNRVTLYGDELWDTETGAQYLDHQLKHFGLHRDEASQNYINWLKKHKLLKTSSK